MEKMTSDAKFHFERAEAAERRLAELHAWLATQVEDHRDLPPDYPSADDRLARLLTKLRALDRQARETSATTFVESHLDTVEPKPRPTSGRLLGSFPIERETSAPTTISAPTGSELVGCDASAESAREPGCSQCTAATLCPEHSSDATPKGEPAAEAPSACCCGDVGVELRWGTPPGRTGWMCRDCYGMRRRDSDPNFDALPTRDPAAEALTAEKVVGIVRMQGLNWDLTRDEAVEVVERYGDQRADFAQTETQRVYRELLDDAKAGAASQMRDREEFVQQLAAASAECERLRDKFERELTAIRAQHRYELAQRPDARLREAAESLTSMIERYSRSTHSWGDVERAGATLRSALAADPAPQVEREALPTLQSLRDAVRARRQELRESKLMTDHEQLLALMSWAEARDNALDTEDLRKRARSEGLSPATSERVLDALDDIMAELADAQRKLGEAWDSEVTSGHEALKRIRTLERDLADARAKLGQAWDEGARWGMGRTRRLDHDSVARANPYALAERERAGREQGRA